MIRTLTTDARIRRERCWLRPVLPAASGSLKDFAGRFSELLTAYRLADVIYSCWQLTCLNKKRTSRMEPWIC